MNYLLTIAFNNEKVLESSYKQLVATMKDDPCQVLLLDNNYPLIGKGVVENICKKYGFRYFNAGTNLGLHNGYNYLIKQLPKECDRFIVYDGDSFPVTPNWHLALLKVHDDDTVVWSSLHNVHSFREMDERGYKDEMIEGLACRIPNTAVVNSVSAWSTEWLKDVKGFNEPSKYYGGLECAMNYKRENSYGRWVFLKDYTETQMPEIFEIHDKIYIEYKVEHAIKGNPISFDEFLKQRNYEQVSSDNYRTSR